MMLKKESEKGRDREKRKREKESMVIPILAAPLGLHRIDIPR